MSRPDASGPAALACARLSRRGALGVLLGAAPLSALPRRAALAQGSAPAALGMPSQSPILTVSGKITITNQGDTAVFDRAMLEQLGMTTINTATPWYDGPMRFEGPLLSRLMQAVGATGDTATAIALNDYSIDIPVADFARFGPILAMRRNGQPMRVADKGPLFVIYPYDSNPELKNRQYYSRSVWSLAQFVIR